MLVHLLSHVPRSLDVLSVLATAVFLLRANRRWRLELRAENAARQVARHAHRYVRGVTPILHSFEAINLAIGAERAGATRWAAGFTS